MRTIWIWTRADVTSEQCSRWPENDAIGRSGADKTDSGSTRGYADSRWAGLRKEGAPLCNPSRTNTARLREWRVYRRYARDDAIRKCETGVQRTGAICRLENDACGRVMVTVSRMANAVAVLPRGSIRADDRP